MPDFPTGIPDIPNAALSDTLFSMHANLGHVPATNRILLNLNALATKLGIGTSAPAAVAAVLRRTASGASAWGPVQAADHVRGGTANRVLKTTDGTACAFAQANGADIEGNAIGLAHIQANSIDNAKILTGVIDSRCLAAAAATQLNQASTGGADSTTSSTPVDVVSTTATLTCLAGSSVLVLITIGLMSTVSGAVTPLYIKMDSGASNSVATHNSKAVSMPDVITAFLLYPGMAAGPHTWKMQWSTNAGRVDAYGVRTLIAMEFRR